MKSKIKAKDLMSKNDTQVFTFDPKTKALEKIDFGTIIFNDEEYYKDCTIKLADPSVLESSVIKGYAE